MLRLHVAAQPVAVGTDGVDEVVAAAGLLHQLRRLDAVLLGPHLKVNVVQQTGGGPEVGLVAVAQLVCVPTHDALYGQSVLDVKRLLVILPQGGQSGLAADDIAHKNASSVNLCGHIVAVCARLCKTLFQQLQKPVGAAGSGAGESDG